MPHKMWRAVRCHRLWEVGPPASPWEATEAVRSSEINGGFAAAWRTAVPGRLFAILLSMKDSDKRQSAKAFSLRWADKGDEKQEIQKFWIDLIQNVLGLSDAVVHISFELPVKIDHTSYIDAYIESTRVLIEQKSKDIDLAKPALQSDGTLLTPFQQARRYAGYLPFNQTPRWIIVCNFRTFHIHDMNKPNAEPEVIKLCDLAKEYHRLDFIVKERDELLHHEEEISIKAGLLVGKLYDALLKQYRNPESDETLRSLNKLCVCLVFCLYAEDAGIFQSRLAFHNYIAQFPPNQIRRALIDLFEVLDTKPEDRDPYLDDSLAAFPYVNGGLFAMGDEIGGGASCLTNNNNNIVRQDVSPPIEIPNFTEEIKQLLLRNASEDFDWSSISPTIFGAVFESTLNPETRRKGGMHYTSIENIHKVIDPLFLDNLRAELEEIRQIKNGKQRKEKADKYRTKLASLTFLDPACGSGNFLTETYISLRRLENEALRIIYEDEKLLDLGGIIKVNINQFYGIEINDFAVTVAKTALWIAESQMLKETEDIVHTDIDFLPLKSYSGIVEGNALRMDWAKVVASAKMGGDALGGDASCVGKNSHPHTLYINKDFIFQNDKNYFNQYANIEQTHGDLPHWHQETKIQFVTFRLADSIPHDKYQMIIEEKERYLAKFTEPLTTEQEDEVFNLFDIRLEKYLNDGYGECVFKDEKIRKILEDALNYFNGTRYLLHAFVIMPNHVHLLIEPLADNKLIDILHSIKSFSANQINKALNRNGTLWQKESFDRIIRNETHYHNTVKYIQGNADALWSDASIGGRRIPASANACNENLTGKADAGSVAPQSVAPTKLDYIMGNPPFVGYSLQSKEQKDDILALYIDEKGKPYKTAGKIDYVAGWYWKAADLMQGTTIRAALVSTNSITQGEQVAAVWKPLYDRFGVQIDFAHRTFRWDSEASAKAHVHCVIIGFSCIGDNATIGGRRILASAKACNNGGKADAGSIAPQSVAPKKLIFTDGKPQVAKNISPYLIDAENVFVESNKKPICAVPEMLKGSSPVDGGGFFLDDEQYADFIKQEPKSQKFIKKFLGAREFLHNENRWCLWLVGITPNEINSLPLVRDRIQEVKEFRLKSTKEATQKFADYPTRFMEMRQPETNYILVPRHSSENRRYIPLGFMTSNVICGDANNMIPNATLFHFGVLTSSVHMAWVRAICGRIKSDYRYSNDIVYNNFPWPMGDKMGGGASGLTMNNNNTVRQDASPPIANIVRQDASPPNPPPNLCCEKIEKTAQAILDARALYPDSSLAALYDELTMPPELRKAHQTNDRAVLEAYGLPKDITEPEIVAHLMAMYKELTK